MVGGSWLFVRKLTNCPGFLMILFLCDALLLRCAESKERTVATVTPGTNSASPHVLWECVCAAVTSEFLTDSCFGFLIMQCWIVGHSRQKKALGAAMGERKQSAWYFALAHCASGCNACVRKRVYRVARRTIRCTDIAAVLSPESALFGRSLHHV